MEKVELHVEGMACGECEAHVNRAVRQLPGIKKVKSSRRKKQTVVEYDPAQVTVGQIRDAVNATGYEVK